VVEGAETLARHYLAVQVVVLALITKYQVEQVLLVKAIMAAFLKPPLMVLEVGVAEQGLLELMELL
jgi:hypothetical protein